MSVTWNKHPKISIVWIIDVDSAQLVPFEIVLDMMKHMHSTTLTTMVFNWMHFHMSQVDT